MTAAPDARAAQRGRTRPRFVDEFERFGLVLAWALCVAVFGWLRPESFLTWANFSTIFGSQAVLVVVTLGLIVPLTAGDFDLSIASCLTLSSMVIAVLNVDNKVPIGWAILAALATGLLAGIANAIFILYFRIHSLIVTLGVGTFLNGITLWISNSMTISGIASPLVQYVIVKRIFGVPLEFYYAILLCLLLLYIFVYTAAGWRLLFVGRGREVARLSGINVNRTRFSALVASSVIGAAAGVLYAGTTGAADPTSGLSYLLPAWAAAYLGATSIRPGRFNPIGSVIAVYFLVTGITGLSILGISTFVQDLFYGGALVIAVSLSQLVRGREERLT
ncbi:MAG: ABC transporter permease [Acetobacteraceae bacterium]